MRRLLRPERLERLQRGQSLVEMAFGFVLLLIALSGLLDVGRAYFIYIAMEDAAGEAALYLSIDPACRRATDYNVEGQPCTDPNNAEFRAREAGQENINWADAEITINRPTIYGVGDPVSVTIRYPVKLLTPFMPRFAGINPIYLETQASQIIIRER